MRFNLYRIVGGLVTLYLIVTNPITVWRGVRAYRRCEKAKLQFEASRQDHFAD